MDELATRPVPWDRIEIAWARNRPIHERPPTPRIGDILWYRHSGWDTELEQIVVLDIQDPDDREDPNLWHQVKNAHGIPIIDGLTPRMAPAADPWPWIAFRRDPDSDRLTSSREARLRGSAGWLPLDWRARPERWRLPHVTATVVRPPLPPLNVPRIGG